MEKHGKGSAPEDAAQSRVLLPVITHLQFLVLDFFRAADVVASAQQIIQALKSEGIDSDGPKFYQLMKRMEKIGVIRIETRTINIPGGSVDRSFYQLTSLGVTAWRMTREFYETRRKVEAIF